MQYLGNAYTRYYFLIVRNANLAGHPVFIQPIEEMKSSQNKILNGRFLTFQLITELQASRPYGALVLASRIIRLEPQRVSTSSLSANV